MYNTDRSGDGDVSQNGSAGATQNGRKADDKQHLVGSQSTLPKYDGEDQGSDGKGEEEEKPPKVPTFDLFRFATRGERVVIFLAVVCSLINGVSYPFMVAIFAFAVQAFVTFGKYDELLKRIPEFLEAYNLTWKDAREDLEGFEKYCPALWDFYNGTYIKSCDLLEDEFDDVFQIMEDISWLYFGGGCITATAAFFQIFLFIGTSERQMIRLRLAFYRNIMRQEMSWFDANSCGEMTVKLTDDISRIHDAIGDKLGTALQYLSGSVFGFIIIFYYGWELALVMQIGAPFLVLAFAIMGVVFTNMSTLERQAYAKAGSIAEEVFSSMRTVQAFNGQEKEAQRYENSLMEAREYGIKKSMASGFGQGASWGIILSTLGLGFWYGGKLVRDGDYDVDEMMAVFMVALIGCQCLGLALPAMFTINAGRAAAYGVYNILDRKSEIDSASESGLQPQTLTGNIALRGVHFTYPTRADVKILNGIDLAVPAGKTVALVGQSGCGKSTVIQLLQRFYDPDKGSVCLDGVDLREINIRWLRQHIGIVGQEPVLFATTIGENIRYGREGATMDEIIRACKNANAYDFIMKLPDGFDTHVGERGAQLSGGQKQRIAIARALVRNPKVLLLDEATSALDTESEAIVQDALDKASKGRTTIIIAHRLSTIRNADTILVFDKGLVAEKGNHEELMAKQGIYFDLVSSQEKAMENPEVEEKEKKKEKKKTELVAEDLEKKRRKSSTRSSVSEREVVAPNTWSRIFKLSRPEWHIIFFGCVAAFANGASQPAWSLVLAEAIEAFASEDDNHQKNKMRDLSLIAVAIGFANFITYFFQDYMFGISGETLTVRIRGMLFRAFTRQNIAFFDDPEHETGVLASQLATEASLVQGAVKGTCGYALLTIGNLGIGLVLAFIYSWELALVVSGFIPIILCGYCMVTKLLSGADTGSRKVMEDVSKEAMESIDNIRTVAALTKEQTIYEQFQERMWAPWRTNMKAAFWVCLLSGTTMGTTYWSYGACFMYAKELLKDDDVEFGDVFRVIGCVVFCSMQLGRSIAFAPDFNKAKKAASFIFNFHDQVPTIDAFSKAGQKPAEGSFSARVSFNGIHFRYPMRPDITILNGLNLSVEPGQTLALVGESGCGKSTSVQLVERFYDPEQGAVSLDKYDLKDLNIQWLRSQIGLVSQEPILFDQSIAENIAYGDNSRTVPMEEIIQAAKNANIHNFIYSLPAGYDTNVGSKGTQLSGGQKQRVAIARALVRNPKILLLDEATSALDNESEKIVQEALDKAREGRTCITIAHRLTTIKDADKIAVFKAGVVHEIGDHDSLMAKQGLYYNLRNAQGH